MINKLCEWISKHLPSFTIAKDGKKYLTRYYLFGADRQFGNIFLHHFHSSDMDIGTDGFGLLHSHRWSGLSFILASGYKEERRKPDGTIIVRTIKPFSFNYLSKKDFHRADLLDEENGAWTIFFTGPRKKNLDWFFWDRVLDKKIPWQEVEGAIE